MDPAPVGDSPSQTSDNTPVAAHAMVIERDPPIVSQASNDSIRSEVTFTHDTEVRAFLILASLLTLNLVFEDRADVAGRITQTSR